MTMAVQDHPGIRTVRRSSRGLMERAEPWLLLGLMITLVLLRFLA